MSREQNCNSTGLSFTVSGTCIHQEFERQVRQTPDAVAVNWADEQLTYGQLNAQANQLAHHLRQIGVGPEKPVALYLERKPQMVTAILGVLKAGGTYVPIDLAYPQERLSFMLEDSQAPVLLTEESLRGRLPKISAQVLCLDSGWESIGKEPEQDLLSTSYPQNAAYIIYTSGSTGKPKGVIVTHHNVVRLLKQTAPWYGFNSSDVWPLFHSYAFDVSVWELWGSLFHGGRLVVVPHLVTRTPGDFYQVLAREKVTVLNQTPSAFRQLIWAEESAPVPQDLNLRYVICAGEALELQSLKPWFKRHGDERPRVINMYGITETTVHSTYRVIRMADVERGAGSLIGVPIPDLQIHLVDDQLKPVPAGVPGEICVGGAGVARGYLNRPELTAQRFLADPFSTAPGARLYRSGDLAQVNADGEMEYLGRMDHQVKIRGFRVELGELESALNRHPTIRESVVIARDTAAGDKRLVAYFVPVAAAPSTTELREFLGKTIPDYMLPAVFMPLKSLPLTTNGKVDRRALPSPDGARPQLKSDFVAPRSPTEEKLAAIWQLVLELEKVGVNDNYFELGGDSIRAITLLAKAQEVGLPLSLLDIFQAPTVAGLAERVGTSTSQPVFAPTKPFSLVSSEDRARLPGNIEDAYPLSRLQLGMFYYNELDPLSAIYHDVFSYRIQSAFGSSKMEQVLRRLTQRHALMRTSFHLAGFSQPLQLVHQQVGPVLTIEDLRPCSPEQQTQLLVQWVEAEKRRPFERTTPPLFRFHVQLQSDTCFQLIISFHHCCLDGWSLAALLTEILRDYAALAQGNSDEISPPRVTYRDFIKLEQEASTSAHSHDFWMASLQDATPQTLPRWPEALREGGHEQKRGPEIQLDDDVFKGLKAIAHSTGVPLRSVLLAAHVRVMSLLYGQTDVLTGNVANGRPEAVDGERLIGLFLNTLPLRQQLNGGSWVDLVKQTFKLEQELLPHRWFPLAEIQKLKGGQPLFETAFDFVHFHVYRSLQGLQGINLAEGHYFEANNLALYTTFMLDVSSSHLELHLDYDPTRVCRQQAVEITHYYVQTLCAMASKPEARYEDFSPLSAGERRRLLLEWNDTQEDFSRDTTLSELFKQSVQRNPDAVALVYNSQVMTYGQLSNKAEEIAQQLRAAEVQAEELVGLCVQRCPEMVAGLLGILKAGAAYVPLDPAYPKERLALMLNDAKLRLVLTQKSLCEQLPVTSARLICLDPVSEARNGSTRRTCQAPPAPYSNTTAAPGLNIPLRDLSTQTAGRRAYVIYTSGSTGRPKAVEVTQQAVVNVVQSIARKTGFTLTDNFLAVTTLSFDIAALELFLPLLSGARLTLASQDQAGDGTALASLMAASGATYMQGTPATWRLLLESGWSGNQTLTAFCGGEALKRSLADELLGSVKAVWNFYGPTETTIWSTGCRVRPGEPICIGRPLANTQVYVLDTRLRPVPVGTVGQLYIGGDGLARGYLGQPQLTAERFIPLKLDDAVQRRVYRTGDLARFLPDGTLECLGRTDHQVKIRGFRIELGEVETALRRCPGIAEAVVTAREDALGEKQLVAYLLSNNGPLSAIELRSFLKSKLPLYMVPAHFVSLEQLPLTPNGKLDLLRLPAPECQAVDLPQAPPRTPEEQELANIWQEVLRLPRVGIDQNFFELGGDSLSATRAYARINCAFGTELTLREMLERPTITGLAELVSRAKDRASATPLSIPRRPRAIQLA